MQERLRQFLRQVNLLTPDEIGTLAAAVQAKEVRKGDVFLRRGGVCREVIFIAEGVMRISEIIGGTEATIWFLKEDQFFTEPESFNSQRPTTVEITAVTDCRYLALTYETFTRFYATLPNFPKLFQRLTNDAFLQKVKYRNLLLQCDAKTRYETFAKETPDLLRRVPLGFVASYLGITPQSLSRLRRGQLANVAPKKRRSVA
ncbi:MAG: Crp/Fnr family transcriptional regulator [Rhizobacter sp.]|nr:Crp/Fnr family transcriptional regulator [Chlorobiales bacterium]